MADDNGKVNDFDGEWIIIPNQVAQLTTISAKAKILFGAIWSLSHRGHGECFASNDRLAAMGGMRRDSHFRALLASLARVKLIKRTYNKKKHRYEIRPTLTARPIIQESPPPPEKMAARKPGTQHARKHGSLPPENLASSPCQKTWHPPTANAPAPAGFVGDGHAIARDENLSESEVESLLAYPELNPKSPREAVQPELRHPDAITDARRAIQAELERKRKAAQADSNGKP